MSSSLSPPRSPSRSATDESTSSLFASFVAFVRSCTFLPSLLPSPPPLYDDDESGRRTAMIFHPIVAVYFTLCSWFNRPPPLENLDGTPIPSPFDSFIASIRSKFTLASSSSKAFLASVRSKFTLSSSSSKKVSKKVRRGFPLGRKCNHFYHVSAKSDHFTALLAVFSASNMQWETAVKLLCS
ncbi:hypothetical protein QL285_048399 [Trifolium repens]|nr:hypothetical protein QL285_048399 [Trifolium repens]